LHCNFSDCTAILKGFCGNKNPPGGGFLLPLAQRLLDLCFLAGHVLAARARFFLIGCSCGQQKTRRQRVFCCPLARFI
jgi:hypothetical protein